MMPKRNALIIVAVLAALAVAVVVLAVLNKESVASKQDAQDRGVFYIYAGDAEYAVSLDDIEALGPFDIAANHKSSGNAAETQMYQGVSLKEVLASLQIDATKYGSVSFLAADGYASSLTVERALDENNCYIVTAMDGKPLGTRADGGSGPFMMILANDAFSQNWCKFLLEIRFK